MNLNHRGVWLSILLLSVTGCSSQRSVTAPRSEVPVLGQFEEPAREPVTGGPTESDVQELARLFAEARLALNAGRQDAAEGFFEDALDRISDIELQFGELSQDYDDYNRLVDDILER